MQLRDGLAIFVGGMAGTAARAGLTAAMPGATWPATLAVNLAGAFLLGLLLELLTGTRHSGAWRRRARLALGTGLLSSLTTYSSFAYEVWELGLVPGAAYAVATVVGGILAAVAGIALGKTWVAR